MTRLFSLTAAGFVTAKLGAEQVVQQRQHPLGLRVAQAVIDRLGLLASAHQPLLAKPGEMLRQSGLAKVDALGKLADRQLAARRQMAQDEQPDLVGHGLEHGGRFVRLPAELHEKIQIRLLVH